jgi:protein required for attachment to host cells
LIPVNVWRIFPLHNSASFRCERDAMKPVKTWVVVADSAHARIFENTGPGHGLKELPGRSRETELKPSRDIDADRPGRSFDSGGQGRHAMEPPTDSKRHEKGVFAKEIADMLRAEQVKGAFDRLVVVAAPATLGDLRTAMSKELADAVTGELDKDLIRLNERDLEGHLGDFLAV